MALINPPGLDSVDSNGVVNPGWRNFFVAIYNLLFGLTQSGETVKRPTSPASLMWVGRTYFDTDLGLPIWWNGSDWIDAQGTVV